jgi:superfamily II DNA/RNA helicase
MLFSATMPGEIVTLARRYQNKPVHIRVNDPDEGHTKADIKQFIYRAHALDKDEVVARILQAEGRGKTVIFTKTKRQAGNVCEALIERGFPATALHGDMSQEARERSLNNFRSGKKEILVATEVAARGIDVDDVSHVINYTVPEDDKAYLHRIGRTGRAGRTGIAVTFVDWDDLTRWGHINQALELNVPEPIETYSSSEHLYLDLNIPSGTKGRINKAQVVKPVSSKQDKPGAQKSKPESAKIRKPRQRIRNYKNNQSE